MKLVCYLICQAAVTEERPSNGHNDVFQTKIEMCWQTNIQSLHNACVQYA